MTRKLIILLASIALFFQIAGCTSNKAQDESEIIENADVAKIEADASAVGDGLSTEDASLQEALGEATADANVQVDSANAQIDSTGAQLDASAGDLEASLNDSTNAATEAVTNSADIAAAPTLDESSLNDIPPPDAALADLTETPVDVSASTGLESAPAPLDESTNVAAVTDAAPISEKSSTDYGSYDDTPKPKASGSLKKVALTAPYQSDGGWVNTVYVARPGEKLKDISMKVFNADKSKELKKIAENSYLKARSVKAGDKIYYVSPNRPDDSSKMLVYYEDIGMMPETYVAKKGDRLKNLGKDLLGHEKGWVELWTSNSFETKDKLAEGEVIRFWRSTSSINMADNNQQPSAPTMMDQSQMQPPPDQNQQMAMNNPPPPDMMPPPPAPGGDMPPPPDQMAMGSTDVPPPPDANIPPPPPSDPAMAGADVPPPPDPAGAPKKKFTPDDAGEEAAPTEMLDQDTMMSLAAVGALLVAFVFIRIRSRKKRMAEEGMAEHGVS